ncbi:DUF397 domain-containing protein [Streptomyces sp. NPDC005385]|uniref:DUF397 domain-containing protein n=1 Tax=Streptomyces sp. NPDC005385 TaxID=3157039 RepID=UPI00339DC49E
MSAELRWYKSSYSTEQGGDCLEAAYDWFKSTYSSDEGECLEVAHVGPRSGKVTAVHLRDSKNPAGHHLRVSPQAWAAFTAAQ